MRERILRLLGLNREAVIDPSLSEAASLETSAERFSELAGQSKELARVVASNPAAPAELLKSLAVKHAGEVLAAVARNPNTSVEYLISISGLAPAAFFENPSLQILLLEDPNFWKRFNDGQLAALGRAPNAEVSFLVFLAEKSYYRQKLAAEHPKTPPEILLTLLRSLTKETSLAASQNDSLPDQLKSRLLALKQTGPLLPEAEVTALAGQGQWPRVWVCSSVRTPLVILRWLLRRFPSEECLGALSNPNIPVELLDDILQHFLKAAANTPHRGSVLIAIARHPSCSLEQAKRLLRFPWGAVEAAAAEHPLLPEDVLLGLARSLHQETRVALARRPGLSLQMQLALREDLDGPVRNALAQKYPKAIEGAQLWRKQMDENTLSEAQLRSIALGGPFAMFDIVAHKSTPSPLRRELILQMDAMTCRGLLYHKVWPGALDDIIATRAPLACRYLAQRYQLPAHLIEPLAKMGRSVQDALFSHNKSIQSCQWLLENNFEPAAESFLAMSPVKTREQLQLVLSKVPKPWKNLCVALCQEPNLPEAALPILLPRFWQHIAAHPKVHEWAKDPALFSLFPKAMRRILASTKKPI